MRFGMFLPDIMHIVCRHERKARGLGNRDKIRDAQLFLFFQTVVENFQVEIIFAEDFGIFLRQLNGPVDLVVAAGFAHFTRNRPDVLLLDLAMPGEDGFSLLRRIRYLSRFGS